jgi:hypothetical protein
MNVLKIYLLFVILSVGANNLPAQNMLAVNWKNASKSETRTGTEEKNYQWEFISIVPSDFDETTLQEAENDDLGQRIACLKVLMEKFYIHKEEIVAGDPMMRTVIRKPNIYNTARKIEKHLKKEVKKGNLETQIAANELAYVLEVALAAVEEETGSFESQLAESKESTPAQINVFKKVKLNNIY